MFIYIFSALLNLNNEQTLVMNKILNSNEIQKLYEEILGNLEEGIILFKNDQIEYLNEAYVKIIDRLLIDRSNYVNGKPSKEEMSHIRFLSIYRDN